VSFSHYPKNVDNLVFAWVQPPPPDVASEEDRPDFLGRPFSEMNRFQNPIAPGESVVGYHDAQPFTRFYGSIASDQPLDVSITFSNDEVDAEGRVISDDNIGSLNYDAHGVHQLYDPTKQEQTGRVFSMIFGRWIKIEIKNLGDRESTVLRAIVRGSVF
jgi:hypothetical protein